MYGWIVKVVTWDDVTLDNHLLTKGRAWLAASVNEHATIELTAVDMHLLDRSIESYNVCEYVQATSKPHGLDALMLCSKQTMDLLKPDNDTVTLGYSYGTFTGSNVKLGASVSTLGKTMSSIKQEADSVAATVAAQGQSLTKLELLPSQLTLSVTNDTDNTSASIQLAVNNEDGTTTLLGSAAEIKFSGMVTFENLSDGPGRGQTTIDGGWLKGEILEGNIIKGAEFYEEADLPLGRLRLAYYQGEEGLPMLLFDGLTYDSGGRIEDEKSLFAVYPMTVEYSMVGMAIGGIHALTISAGKITPSSEWNFSNATVTAVFG